VQASSKRQDCWESTRILSLHLYSF
jgi:hypothetical protein